MEQQRDHASAEAIARAARALHAQGSTQDMLQKMVELAVVTIDGCDHAGVTIVTDEVTTPAASSDVPRHVDRIQYETGQGPCLDAIRTHRTCVTNDLADDSRWPLFSSRAVTDTGVRSMLSFRLFLEEDTLGALNLYSIRPAAFSPDSRAVGDVYAAHAALALQAARDTERLLQRTDELRASRIQAERYAEQADLAATLQRSMLTELPDLAPLQVAARYLPATEAAEIGGDWYDAFTLPDGGVKFTVGDLAGHDLNAAVAMGQARNVLRALAVDRDEPPGQLLDRFDTVLSQLLPGQTGTCVCAKLEPRDSGPPDSTRPGGGWRAVLGSAGHLPPLLITDRAASYVDLPVELLLGTGIHRRRSSTLLDLPPGATLLLYTDGLIERRDQHLDDSLAELLAAATSLAAAPVDELCDELLARLAPHPTDDVCLLAVHIPRHH